MATVNLDASFKQFFTLKNVAIVVVVLAIATFEVMPILLYLFGLSYLVVPSGAVAWIALFTGIALFIHNIVVSYTYRLENRRRRLAGLPRLPIQFSLRFVLLLTVSMTLPTPAGIVLGVRSALPAEVPWSNALWVFQDAIPVWPHSPKPAQTKGQYPPPIHNPPWHRPA